MPAPLIIALCSLIKVAIPSRPPRSCLLCQGRLETPVIRESPLWFTFINRNQDLLGKTIIALRRHEEQVASLTGEEWEELRGELEWATKRLRQAFAPDHFNCAFLMNADRHVHLHVIPRYVGMRELAGVEFTDPDYPESYQATPRPSEVASRAVIAAVEAALLSAESGPTPIRRSGRTPAG